MVHSQPANSIGMSIMPPALCRLSAVQSTSHPFFVTRARKGAHDPRNPHPFIAQQGAPKT